MTTLVGELNDPMERILCAGATDWAVLAERESTDGTVKAAVGCDPC